ncbi:inovirus-type Gp2 protein, partial [Vibrio cholerae]|uniref:inovirus-type Gp2 protein n=1 Tax=Vibrio cholerae TaxID=666 RepID=UPI0011D9EA5F
VTNSKHHRSPYISTTFMRFPWCGILNTQETALVNLCDSNPNFNFINRNEPESKKAIFTHCAYLCKFETKAFNISGKNIGHSQIKHKHQK